MEKVQRDVGGGDESRLPSSPCRDFAGFETYTRMIALGDQNQIGEYFISNFSPIVDL